MELEIGVILYKSNAERQNIVNSFTYEGAKL